ncbi:hypothetical protein MM300_02680 [Evansella sp. LMS18]|uniref:ATP-grasp domain-containing protein n=1 Tax=Evansella sp. LMS18 TaxID=2924033 RepID=UPI0020D08777|nr:hypothetical protein [Evansella sp. LMS18]UTR11256.1 hypothetical protein MM300_02680 [Evansella sp. LMS18]
MRPVQKYGWLVYRKIDIERNQRFIELLLQAAEKREIKLSLVPFEELTWKISGKESPFTCGDQQYPDFMINRSVSPWLNELAEFSGIRAFNTSFAARIANDKRLTHAFFQKRGVPMADTAAISPEALSPDNRPDFPFVIKDPYGRGGTGVHFIHNEVDLLTFLSHGNNNELLVQPVSGSPGKDLRVYIVGNEIQGAVLRETSSSSELRANLSTGGTSRLYELNEAEKKQISIITNSMKIDFAGIDFLFKKDGTLLFNEMEDAVGCRSLYMNSSVDIADVFLEYVQKVLSDV